MPCRPGLGEYETFSGLESVWFAALDRLLESSSKSEYEYETQQPARPSGDTTIVSFPPSAKTFVLRGFAPQSAKLPSQHGATISAIAKDIVRRFGSTDQVNGIQLTWHAADAGRTPNDNLDFGLKRARAVRNILETFPPIVTLTSPSLKESTYQEWSAGATQPDSSLPADNRGVVIALF